MTKLATNITEHRYKCHRFPAEIIAHAVWLYRLFPLNLRDVEDLLDERGIDVSFQTVSEWAVEGCRRDMPVGEALEIGRACIRK